MPDTLTVEEIMISMLLIAEDIVMIIVILGRGIQTDLRLFEELTLVMSIPREIPDSFALGVVREICQGDRSLLILCIEPIQEMLTGETTGENVPRSMALLVNT
jgi:hypothetical protein